MGLETFISKKIARRSQKTFYDFLNFIAPATPGTDLIREAGVPENREPHLFPDIRAGFVPVICYNLFYNKIIWLNIFAEVYGAAE